jgi:hypothetical protein
VRRVRHRGEDLGRERAAGAARRAAHAGPRRRLRAGDEPGDRRGAGVVKGERRRQLEAEARLEAVPELHGRERVEAGGHERRVGGHLGADDLSRDLEDRGERARQERLGRGRGLSAGGGRGGRGASGSAAGAAGEEARRERRAGRSGGRAVSGLGGARKLGKHRRHRIAETARKLGPEEGHRREERRRRGRGEDAPQRREPARGLHQAHAEAPDARGRRRVARGHARARPGAPLHARSREAGGLRRRGERVEERVGGCVVGLPCGAEERGDRGEEDLGRERLRAHVAPRRKRGRYLGREDRAHAVRALVGERCVGEDAARVEQRRGGEAAAGGAEERGRVLGRGRIAHRERDLDLAAGEERRERGRAVGGAAAAAGEGQCAGVAAAGEPRGDERAEGAHAAGDDGAAARGAGGGRRGGRGSRPGAQRGVELQGGARCARVRVARGRRRGERVQRG